MSSTHACFRFIVTWAFSTNEKVWKLFDSTRALSSRRRRTVKRAFKRRRFFLLQFKDFSLPGSTISIRDIGKWCFSQFKFRFACVVSPFCVSEQVGSVTIRSRFNARSFQLSKAVKSKVVFTFICPKISTFLFADTYSLQSQANCMALTSATSAKSQHDKQIKQTWTWGFGSLKLLHENTVFFIFCFKIYFLPMFKTFYVIVIIFFLFWWLLRVYFIPTFAL